jgi:hypothetical protein
MTTQTVGQLFDLAARLVIDQETAVVLARAVPEFGKSRERDRGLVLT